MELRVPAGGQAGGSFTVSNETAGPILVVVEAEALTPKGYAPVEPAAWLQLQPSSVILQAGESAKVAYAVRVPHDAVGELASEVVFVQHIGTERGGVQVRMGMALYVAVAGTERLALSIEQMALHASKDGAQAQLRIANHGNIHCRPEGMVSLVNANGQPVAQGRLNRGMPIHPDGIGTFTVPMAVPQPGTYQLTAELTCHASTEAPVRLRAVQQGELHATGSWTTAATSSAPAQASMSGSGR